MPFCIKSFSLPRWKSDFQTLPRDVFSMRPGHLELPCAGAYMGTLILPGVLVGSRGGVGSKTDIVKNSGYFPRMRFLITIYRPELEVCFSYPRGSSPLTGCRWTPPPNPLCTFMPEHVLRITTIAGLQYLFANSSATAKDNRG